MDAILVHGGAGPMRDGRTTRRRDGCRKAAEAGWQVLETTGDPLEAVVGATVVLEDDPVFNAGVGSYLAEDGHVIVDAAVQRGSDLAAGAVAHLAGVGNPVRVARRIVDEELPHVLYVADGARRLAERWDLTVDPEALITEEKRRLWQDGDTVTGADTVGAIAVRDGRLAVAQSTGGTPGKAVGRVGDAPLLGAGLAADDEVGATMATGDGEALLRGLASGRALHRLEGGAGPTDACRAVVELVQERTGGQGGVLAVTPDGRTGLAHSTPYMAWGRVVDGEADTGVGD